LRYQVQDGIRLPRRACAGFKQSRFGNIAAALEGMCWAISGLALGWFLFVHADASLFQARASQELRGLFHTSAHTAAGTVDDVQEGALLGSIDIPEIRLSAVIVQGDDEFTLRRAVGHIPGTPLPGDRGNIVLAAHRDTFFRRLGKLHTGDVIVLKDARGTQRYRVAHAAIVSPSDTGVMRPADGTLTLVTCYPFNYFGSAPDRYVVSAAKVSGTFE
jgi:LPXTG-site transpeptidase (sortase) family protein